MMLRAVLALCVLVGIAAAAPNAADTIVQLDDLKSFSEEFTAKSREAEAYVDSKMSEMTQNLDMNIARLGDQLAQLRQTLTSGVFVNHDAEPVVVLGEFNSVRARLQRRRPQLRAADPSRSDRASPRLPRQRPGTCLGGGCSACAAHGRRVRCRATDE